MRHAFDAALEDVERKDTAARPALPGFAIVAPPLTAAPAAPTGHHSLWEFAAAWTPEADPAPPRPEPAPPPPPPRPSGRLEDIAAELELATLKTPADLALARRRFMWDNHPDRRDVVDRDLANRRVALANMLLDRALARLRKPPGR